MLLQRVIVFLSAVLWIQADLSTAQDSIAPKQLEFFEKKIRPVLVKHCYSCHSKDTKSVKGGLVLDTSEGIRAGGDSGHSVVPGDLEASLLMEAIRYESVEMPPREKLPESVINDFAQWIEMGAPDPRKGPSLIKREINFTEAKTHWSFQPIRVVEPPTVKRKDWPKTAVDQFILSELEKKSLKPAKDAERLTLIRRLYFDLIGLPPTDSELTALLNDDSPKAIENLVDRLLASPQFGERWARHWMDVVRYAESNGRERNFVYPNAWRYRDYVIDVFNTDHRFDDFVREQIAGDLLVTNEQTPDERNKKLVATGFLAIGPKLLNENNKNAFLMDLVDDQVDVTTRAFMGLTVSCARCHDHKFDPIPTAEYYSMAGIFRSTQTMYGTKRQNGNRQPSELIGLSARTKQQEAQGKQIELAIKDIAKRLGTNQKKLANLQKQFKTAQKKKAESNQIQRLKRLTDDARKVVQSISKELKEAKESGVVERAMGVREGRVADSPVYIRGEISSPKGTSPRGFLTILDPELQQPLLKTKESGRAELAEWIVSKENPLTSRVLVNRVWHHLFGTGLVRTVDNFGTTGEKPSHPDLLDYLAARFQSEGWSVKQLIRNLVLSRTYQLSGQYQTANYTKDPGNRLQWRHSPQRMDAEALRDAMLLASGKLNLQPAVASVVAKLSGEYGRGAGIGPGLQTNTYRSVYLPIVRNAVPDSLKLFDFAEPSILVGERPVTTVPTQALFFLNSTFVSNQCDELASKLLNQNSMDDAARVDAAYRTVLSRPATESEIGRAMQFIDQTAGLFEAEKRNKPSGVQHAWAGFCQALFGSAEFRYVE